MPETKKMGLTTAAGGVAEELFDHAMKEVMANIDDVNTGPGKRKLILEFVFEPHEDRHNARNEMVVAAQVRTKLQPIVPASSYAFISRKDGKAVAYTHDVHQEDLLEQKEHADKETGEVVDIKSRQTGA